MTSSLQWPPLSTMDTTLQKPIVCTMAIYLLQPPLYNGQISIMALSLIWPPLYNGFFTLQFNLSTMATSLCNGYYTLQKPIVCTMAFYLLQPPLYNGQISIMALSLIWPPLYNGFFTLQFNLSTMATSLQPKRPLKVSQMPGEELSDSLGLEEPPIMLFFNFRFILSCSHEHISLFKPL